MRIAVIGSSIVDLIARPVSTIRRDSSNEAVITWSAGGAGRNVAENLSRLGAEITFVTDVGDDVLGRFLLVDLRKLGIDVRVARTERTGVYIAVLERDGGLNQGFCQTGTERISVDEINAVLPDLESFDGAVIDANLSADVVDALAVRCRRAAVPYALETAAHERSLRVARAVPGCAFIKPDRGEASVLADRPCETVDDALSCAESLLARGAMRVAVSLGPDGLVFAENSARVRLPALRAQVADVTGAGDALLSAAFLGLLRDLPPDRYLQAGLRAAALTCEWRGAVNPALTARVFDP